MVVKMKKYADKRHWRFFKRIHKQECLNAADLYAYLEILNELQNSRAFVPFFMKCLKGMESVKTKFYEKSLSQTFADSLSGITFIFGRSLLEIKCTSELYSEIIQIWSALLPDTKSAFQEAVLINEGLFQELFNQLPKLGHAIMQWDLIEILLKYTLYSSLTSAKLLKLMKGPAYERVRKSFKKISSNIDHHSLDILKKINEDAVEKLVVRLTAIDGFYNGKKKINAIKFEGVSQPLVVYFNIGKPGISCLFDMSTLNENDANAIHVFDIGLENIRKVTIVSKLPYEENFAIKIKFKNINRNGIKKLVFNFRNSQFEHMIKSNVFAVLQIERKIYSAHTPSFKRPFANTDQREYLGRCCNQHTHSFKTTAESRYQTCSEVYVNVSNVSRLETTPENRNQTYMLNDINNFKFSSEDHKTGTLTNASRVLSSARKFSQRAGVKQRAKYFGSTLIDGIQQLSTETGFETCPYLCNINVGSRMASRTTAAENINQTYPIIYISDSEISLVDYETEIKKKRGKQTKLSRGIIISPKKSSQIYSSSNFIEGIKRLSNENDNNVTADSDLDKTDIWNPQVSFQSYRQTYKNSSVHSQKDIDFGAATQNSRKSNANSVFTLRSNQMDSQPTEMNPKQISKSAINFQLNVPLSYGASHTAVNPKPARRKLFDHKNYNESREMSTNTQSVQTNENHETKTIQDAVNVPTDLKTAFHLTDDPFRVLEFEYSSDELSNNLHSKRRSVNNETRFKSLRSKSNRNAVAKDSELISMASRSTGQSELQKNNKTVPMVSSVSRNSNTAVDNNGIFLAEYSMPAAMANLVSKTDSSWSECKRRRLDSYNVNIADRSEQHGDSETKTITFSSSNSTKRIQNAENKLASKRSNTSMQNSDKSVNKKAKYSREKCTSQENVIQSLDHSETVRSRSQPTFQSNSENNAVSPVPQCTEIENKILNAILLEIERQKNVLETACEEEIDEEITSDYICQLILEGKRFNKETSELFEPISILLAKNIKHSEKLFRCGNKVTDAQAEQLKQLEERKLYSAKMMRKIVESILMVKDEFLQRVLANL